MPDVFLLPVFVGHKCPTYSAFGAPVSARIVNGGISNKKGATTRCKPYAARL